MSLTKSEIIISLRQIGSADTARVGRKAAVLGDLTAAGFAVPDGIVLTTAALARARAAGAPGSVDGADPPAAPLPEDVAAAVAQIPDLLGAGPYAVRSSAIDEDRGDASFAGQYETVLNVSAQDLPAAVRRCWSSAFADHLRGYRRGRGAAGDPDDPAVAVLVQPMLPAAAAGVAFTADPVTGDRDTVTLSVVPGLGDGLVSGAVSPDEWLVSDGVATARATPHQAVPADTVLAVAALARRVEAHLGAPQDIEWAIVAGEPVLLQARPITALPAPPIPVPATAPAGFWRREASHSPKPWTPMFQSVFGDRRNQALRRMFAAFGLPENTLEFREIGGWYYLKTLHIGGRRTPPAWLIRLLVRALPRARRHVRDIVASQRDDTAGTLIERWYDRWQPDLATRIAALRDVDPARLDDAALAAHADRALALVDDGCTIHYLLHGALAPILAELVFACRDLIGWPDARAFDMLNGLSTTSTAPARQLNRIARLAAAQPAAYAALTRPDGTTLDELRAVAPEVASALDAHLHEYGHRALRYELVDPCLAELPQLTLQLLAHQLTRAYDPAAAADALRHRRTGAVEAARAALAGRPSADRQRFEAALARAQRAYPVREDNEMLTFSAPIALLRYALLELGRRLAASGRIAVPADVFLLTYAEARAALADPDPGSLRPLVSRRRGERNWIEHHPGPPSYGTAPPPPPTLRGLPAEVRFSVETLQWSVDRIFAADAAARQHTSGTATVEGIPASGGQYTGPVRIIRDEMEFDRLRPGDVLVCPITSPVWSVLFPTVGALVTDSGGILSHPAIIAREYQTPAVVATGNATTVLRDGLLVTVDGAQGRVEIHPAEQG